MKTALFCELCEHERKSYLIDDEDDNNKKVFACACCIANIKCRMQNKNMFVKIKKQVAEDLIDHIFYPVECNTEAKMWKQVNHNVWSTTEEGINSYMTQISEQIRCTLQESLG